MKAEINNENKAKFFAQYWGQRIWRTPVNYDVSIRIAGLIDLEKSDAFVTGYLELKSLSNISDEDAIEVYCRNLLAFPKEKSYLDTKSFSNNILKIKISCHNYPYLKTEYFDIEYIDIFRSDFLRSRGYLVPWMGLSCEEIIEAGWAKYKE